MIWYRGQAVRYMRSFSADRTVVSLPGLDQAAFVGGHDQLGTVAGAEFSQQPADVGLGGGHGDVQRLRDLRVGQAAGDQGQDFAFPVWAGPPGRPGRPPDNG